MEQMNLTKPDTDPKAFIKNVGEFHYEPSVGEIFTTCKNDHDIYLTYLLPLSPKDFTYEETIEKCGKVFGHNTSLFNRRFKCLNLAIRKGEDFQKYAPIGLRSPCNAEIRLKLLSLLDKNPDIMLHHLVDEYNNFQSPIADSNMVESSETRAYQIKKPEINRVSKNRTP
ncbi:unnamed protein product [Hymenolepis diminuta]|uniref:Uncharacterized protein n=1 Tax=Hymenolepis diminuta TaxID=6216 RepID=A0A564Y6I2_HYMDI|nr:unnamed protein product [Hymenolepis diminuta]